MEKVELLSPAGNFQALEGVVHAGADAVYLGGERYGARAYADNFSKEEIIRGIHYAHVFGRKIYLTVNTLVKEKELDPLYDFLLPFYEAGLDGVIVQDLGALCFIRDHFPGLLLHASTQMTVTGWRGAELLRKEGVSRIVPARELSLDEIIEIKARTGMEIEAFIHGAMCYSYSGQCLFSSILGGRSGNRGRCAQPCRLPYSAAGHRESYVLSMRDLCTSELLPELIGAGIDSFKIEGRMKRPEYAAGVTAVYRKYIDRYYDGGTGRIEEEDREMLRSLYSRSGAGEGYYHRHNGKEMLTLTSPAYSETDEALLQKIRESYIDKRLSIPVNARITLEAGKEAVLLLAGGGETVAQNGDMVQEAVTQPLSGEKIQSQIQKSGQSLLDIRQVQVDKKGDVFIPVGALNRLRREASARLERLIAQRHGFTYEARKAIPLKEAGQPRQASFPQKQDAPGKETPAGRCREFPPLHASVLTKGQLLAAIRQKIGRIYLDYTLLAENGAGPLEEILEAAAGKGIVFYGAVPYIVRSSNESCLPMVREAVYRGLLSGVLIRNLESFGFFEKYLSPKQMVLDANLYLWNRESIRFFAGKVGEYYLPAECNAKEWERLGAFGRGALPGQSVQIYGRLPMMVSANCVRKTCGACQKASGILPLWDRYGKQFPVYHDCVSCYNVIYNSVPLSLHGLFLDKGRDLPQCRMDFTVENEKESAMVMDYFKCLLSGKYTEPVYGQYTTGHYKRGVE